jgi:hypothetical protein
MQDRYGMKGRYLPTLEHDQDVETYEKIMTCNREILPEVAWLSDNELHVIARWLKLNIIIMHDYLHLEPARKYFFGREDGNVYFLYNSDKHYDILEVLKGSMFDADTKDFEVHDLDDYETIKLTVDQLHISQVGSHVVPDPEAVEDNADFPDPDVLDPDVLDDNAADIQNVVTAPDASNNDAPETDSEEILITVHIIFQLLPTFISHM